MREHSILSSTVCNGQRGFTLMELLISMTISAVIVAIVAGALKLGLSAWEKGEADMEAAHRQRVVLGLLADQLATLLAPSGGSYTASPLALHGGDSTIEYVCHRPILLKGQAALVKARYEVAETAERTLQLRYSETPYVAVPNPERSAEIERMGRERVIFDNFRHIGFEYLGSASSSNAGVKTSGNLDAAQLPWQDEWDPVVESGHPRAVRITFVANAAAEPLRVIVAIHAG